jgi:glycosyltransferase involved in cell wall biosynthesis
VELAGVLHAPLGRATLAVRELRRAIGEADVLHIWGDPALAQTAQSARITAKLPAESTKLPAKIVISPADPTKPASLPWRIGAADATWIFSSGGLARAVLAAGADPKRVATLPPAAQPFENKEDTRKAVRESLGLRREDLLMVAPSELRREAGHKIACWAHAIVRYIRPEGKLLIPGRGRSEPFVRAFARTTGFEQDVYFSGWSLRLPAVLASADIVLFAHKCSLGQTLPAMAMQAGAAILAADVPDLRDLLTHEQTALLVEPNCPRATSAAMLRLQDDPALRAALGQVAQAKAASEFDPRAARTALEEIYKTCPAPAAIMHAR